MSGITRLLVGLGNPGEKYQQTRHNAGFWFLDALAQAYHQSFTGELRFNAQVASIRASHATCLLLKPQTFVNQSGDCVRRLLDFYKLSPTHITVVHDELDLPVGVVRAKQGGGHGGHNGLRDTVAKCGSKDFARLRLGIGHPGHKDKVVSYVLNAPSLADRQAINDAIACALAQAEILLWGDIEQLMSNLNGMTQGGGSGDGM